MFNHKYLQIKKPAFRLLQEARLSVSTLRLAFLNIKKPVLPVTVLSIAFLLVFVNITHADETIVDFEEGSIPVLNESIRKIREDNRSTKSGIRTANTIAVDDITPDVSGGSVFTTSANTGATAITQFDAGKTGQIITVVGGSDTSSSTIADAGNFKLTGAMTLGSTDSITLYYDGTYWIELSRTTN